jgi:hypothetical protein
VGRVHAGASRRRGWLASRAAWVHGLARCGHCKRVAVVGGERWRGLEARCWGCLAGVSLAWVASEQNGLLGGGGN